MIGFVYLSRDDYATEREFISAILQWRARGYTVWTRLGRGR